MRKYLLILVFFIACNNFAQDNAISKITFAKKYYELIHQAEQALFDKNYDKCRGYYKLAFKTGIYHYYDLKNSLNVELESDQTDKLFLIQILEKLAEGSDSLYFFETIIGEDREIIKERLEVDLNHFFSSIEKKINPVLYKKMIEIMQRDQNTRLKCQSKRNDFYNDQECRKEIMYNDSINYSEIKSILREYNNLNQQSVGYEYFNAFYFVVLHNSQWGTKGLESNIKNMVLYGDFPNRSYAALHDRISRNFNKGELEDCSSYGTDLIFEINDKLVVPVLNDSIVDCIDRKRKEIGLERIELFINKRIKQFSIDSLGVYNIGLNYSWGRVPVQMYDRMINSYKKNYSNIKIYERTYSRGDN